MKITFDEWKNLEEIPKIESLKDISANFKSSLTDGEFQNLLKYVFGFKWDTGNQRLLFELFVKLAENS